MKMMSIDDSLKKEWIDKAFVLLLECGLAMCKDGQSLVLFWMVWITSIGMYHELCASSSV